MLDHFGENDAANALENAVMEVTGKHIKGLAAGHMGLSTNEVGDLVAKYATEIK